MSKPAAWFDVASVDIPKLIAERLAAHPALQPVREELAREVLYGTGEGLPQGVHVERAK